MFPSRLWARLTLGPEGIPHSELIMLDQRKRMARFVAISIFALLLGSPLSAFATENGFYLGFSLGQSDIVNPEKLDEYCATAGIVCGDEEKDTAFQGVIGYQINNYFGVEGTVFDLGEPALSTEAPIAANATVNVKGGALSLLPQIPISSIGAIYGRLGAAGGDIELVAEAPSIPRRESASASGGTILWGVGGAINLARATIRLDWQRYAFNETLALAGFDLETPDINVYSATLLLRFPKK